MESIIKIKGVQKKFGDSIALDDINLDFSEGCVHGLLGHNGAGKTTLIRIIGGMYKADKGDVRVLGLNPMKDGHELRKSVGVLSENMCLYDRLTVYENLMFYGKLYNIKVSKLRTSIDNYLKMFELSEFKGKLLKDCSTGMKKKVGIIRSVINDPKILLLDEASNGLDPISKEEFHNLIRELVKLKKMSVVICSHDLEEISKLCKSVTIIKKGKVVYNDNIGNMTNDKDKVEISINAIQNLAQYQKQIEQSLFKEKVTDIKINDNFMTMNINSLKDINTILKVFMEYKLNVIRVEHKMFDLNKIYVESHREENII